jgi:hypothetical protein
MNGFLSIFRRGEAPRARTSAPSLPARPPLPPAPGPALPPPRGLRAIVGAVRDYGEEPRRLLVGFDATGSREPTWRQASRLTDTLIRTLPDRLQVALAVHGGGRLKFVTRYTTNAAALRGKAAEVQCEAGGTRLLDILADPAALKADVVLYIGDSFEESASQAGKLADKLRQCGTRVIILQEGDDDYARSIFAEIAERTGGALLPFDISSFDRVGKELVELIAVLAVEGIEAVEAQQETRPAARVLLEKLDPKRLLISQENAGGTRSAGAGPVPHKEIGGPKS